MLAALARAVVGDAARALARAALSAVSPGRSAPRASCAPTAGSAAWRLLAFGAAVQLGTYVASPYFVPFMLQELRLTYFEYTMATLAVVVAKSIFLPAWGRLVDAHGARAVYPLAALLTAMIPIPFILSQGIVLVLVGQMLSGMSWAGYELSFFSLMLESSYKRTRMPMVAAQNILNGIGAAPRRSPRRAGARRHRQPARRVGRQRRRPHGALAAGAVPPHPAARRSRGHGAASSCCA